MPGPVLSVRDPGLTARGRGARRVGRLARQASRNAWVEGASRLGLVVRGVLYFIPGFLTLKWALGSSERSSDPTVALGVPPIRGMSMP